MEIGLLVEEYGMAVLGLVMFIILWKIVVTPSLSVFQSMTGVLKEIADGQKAHGNILNTIVDRLESLEKKHDARQERADERADARRAG
jgi:sensor histidine kinase YesM